MPRALRTLIGLGTIVGLILAAQLLIAPAAAAQPVPCDPATACIDASLPAGLIGDFYLNGALSAAGVASARLVTTPGAPSLVEVRNIQEPGGAGFGDLYVYPDQSLANLTLAAGQIKTAVFAPKKNYVKGALKYTCNPKGFKATDSVLCRPAIDGAAQADVAPGAAVTINLLPGAHTVHTDLVGDQAGNWSPILRDDTVTISAGTSALQTAKLSADFALKGLIKINLKPAGLLADLYLDGAQIAAQANLAEIYVATGAAHTVEARNIQDPAAPGFNDLFVYADQNKGNVTVTSGQSRAVTFQPAKSYVKGALAYTCTPKGFKATDSVVCRPTIDGVVQADVAAGALFTYNLPAGAHTVHTELAGDQANNWSPIVRDDTVTITAGGATLKTTALKAAFQLKGLLKISLKPAGITGDIYVDGALAGSQTAGVDVYVASGAHTVSVSAVTDPAANGVYRYNDLSATATVSASQTRSVSLQPVKEYLLGYGQVTCRINGLGAGYDVRCNVTVDGQGLGTIEAGQAQTYNLTPGAHALSVAPAGGSAGWWSPAAQDSALTIVGGKTAKVTATFNRKGVLTITLSAPNVVADIFVDGAQLGSQVASAEAVVDPGQTHTVEGRNLRSTLAPDVYEYTNLSAAVTVAANQTRAVTLTVGKPREKCTSALALVRFNNRLDVRLTRRLTGPEAVTVALGAYSETWLCLIPGTYHSVTSAPGFYDSYSDYTWGPADGCTGLVTYYGAEPDASANTCTTNVADYHRP